MKYIPCAMNRRHKTFLIQLTILFFVVNISYSQQKTDRYNNPDISTVYSTHPERPFRYGYPLERDEIFDLLEDTFNAYQIHTGPVVAEIGAASGWLEGAFSLFSDSVTYYIQDIDTNLLNKKQLDAVVEHFSAQRQSKQTNSFHLVIGTEIATNLPEEFFDLIIINNTFHEFSEVGLMMDDIIKKLKPDGRVMIHESFANNDLKVRHGGCDVKAYKTSTVESLLKPSGLYLTKMEFPESSTINYLTFERDTIKAAKFRAWLNEVDPLLIDLNLLNSKKMCSNEKKLNQTLSNLEDDFEQLEEYYPNLTPYFVNLAGEYQKSNKYRCAIGVLRTCLELMPNNVEVYSSLADIYYQGGWYDEALDNFLSTIYLDSMNKYATASAVILFTETGYYQEALEMYQAGLKIDSTYDFFYIASGYLYSSLIEVDQDQLITDGWQLDEISLDREDLLLLALDSYSKAIIFNNLEPNYYISRASIHEKLNNNELALKDYDYAIYLSPYEFQFYRLRALTKLKLDDEEGYNEDWIMFKSMKKLKRKN
jgi:tetratricopeptide (TPR) repeat protein